MPCSSRVFRMDLDNLSLDTLCLAAVIIIFAVYLIFLIADLCKRGFLSRLVPWSGFMLTFPAAVCICCCSIFVCFAQLLANDGKGWLFKLFCGILAIANLAIILLLYIRGHCKPCDSAAPNFKDLPDDVKTFKRARRLIITGAIGSVAYFIIMAVILIKIAEPFWQGSLIETAKTLLIAALLIFVPVFGICFLLFYIGLGIMAGIAMSFGFFAFLENLLVANGCIRFILASDKTKGMKALWIFLSLIPAFNIIYGFYCIYKTSRQLKNN